MKLLEIYNKYKKINAELIEELEYKLNCNILELKLDETMKKSLNSYLTQLEHMKLEVDTISVEAAQENNLKDLNYLILNSLFFLSDIINYCNNKEIERFKMRAVNYINHNRKQEFINKTN